jgi:hypothetical protein
MTKNTEAFDDLNEDLPAQNELDTLKQRADLMGLNYHPSIGVEKLRDKVNAALQGSGDDKDDVPDADDSSVTKGETVGEARRRIQNAAAELVRVRITCMNPAKKEWEGEIFTCGNGVVGTHKKFVPFNNEEGWHVPRIILNMIQDRKCQIFHTVTDSKGNKTRQGKLIKEFAVDVMEPLTQEDLQELAARQALSKSVA